jgi:hypothetical protein
MKEWKIIKRLKKAESEGETIVRSFRLPKELDDYCSQQADPPEFVRDLIRQNMGNELTDAEDQIRASIMRFYIREKKRSAKVFEKAAYPSLEKITQEELTQLLDVVLNDPFLNWNAASISPAGAAASEALKLAEKCKSDRELWKHVYAKIRAVEIREFEKEKQNREDKM